MAACCCGGGNVCAAEFDGGGFIPFIIVDIPDVEVDGCTGGGPGLIGAGTFFFSIRRKPDIIVK